MTSSSLVTIGKREWPDQLAAKARDQLTDLADAYPDAFITVERMQAPKVYATLRTFGVDDIPYLEENDALGVILLDATGPFPGRLVVGSQPNSPPLSVTPLGLSTLMMPEDYLAEVDYGVTNPTVRDHLRRRSRQWVDLLTREFVGPTNQPERWMSPASRALRPPPADRPLDDVEQANRIVAEL